MFEFAEMRSEEECLTGKDCCLVLPMPIYVLEMQNWQIEQEACSVALPVVSKQWYICNEIFAASL